MTPFGTGGEEWFEGAAGLARVPVKGFAKRFLGHPNGLQGQPEVWRANLGYGGSASGCGGSARGSGGPARGFLLFRSNKANKSNNRFAFDLPTKLNL